MTISELKISIGIPPRDESFSQNYKVKYLTYNVDSKNIGLKNNKSIEGLKYDKIETVSFGFVDDSLSIISFDYRGIEFKEYYDHLIKRGFIFKEREPFYWDGQGELYGEEVLVDLVNLFESGIVGSTFYRKTPKILEMFDIESK